jgi:hypothetical protein
LAAEARRQYRNSWHETPPRGLMTVASAVVLVLTLAAAVVERTKHLA